MVESLVDSYDEIVLNGYPMKTRGPVADSNLSVFSGKVVTGDYTKDSNPTLSAWVISDLSGGHGVDDMNEGVDVNRYRIGTLNARYPSLISRPYKVKAIRDDDAAWTAAIGSTEPRFLSDILVAGTWQGIVAFGVNVYRLSNSAGSIGALTAAPVNNAVTYRGAAAVDYVVVPMGASGVARISTAYALTNTAAGATCPAAQAIVIWDNKLIAIDTSGQLWYSTDPTAAWTSYGATAKLPSGSVPRALVRYFDRQGLPAVFIVTDTEVWQFDPNGPEIFSVDVNFPPHPKHGLAACRWSGDLYFSVGVGVHRYTGGSLSSVGPDRDHGLPVDFAGHIVGGGLVPGYNAMYALLGLSADSSQPSLHEWTGTGWHMMWATTTPADTVAHSMAVSRHGDNYRLYFGTILPYHLLYIDLPKNFANPREVSTATWGKPSYTDNYYYGEKLHTGKFNAGMKGYNKLASALDVSIQDISATGSLAVYYQVNGGNATLLGTVTTEGTTSLPFGTLANGIYPGIIFDDIKFEFRLTDTSTNPFLMESAVLSYVPIKPSAYSFTMDLDLTTGHGGLSPEDIKDVLDDILTAGVMVPLVLRGETYRVFLAQVSGSVETGADETAYRRITLLQIPQTLGAG
jgi:hypothetical protein